MVDLFAFNTASFIFSAQVSFPVPVTNFRLQYVNLRRCIQ